MTEVLTVAAIILAGVFGWMDHQSHEAAQQAIPLAMEVDRSDMLEGCMHASLIYAAMMWWCLLLAAAGFVGMYVWRERPRTDSRL